MDGICKYVDDYYYDYFCVVFIASEIVFNRVTFDGFKLVLWLLYQKKTTTVQKWIGTKESKCKQNTWLHSIEYIPVWLSGWINQHDIFRF